MKPLAKYLAPKHFASKRRGVRVTAPERLHSPRLVARPGNDADAPLQVDRGRSQAIERRPQPPAA